MNDFDNFNSNTNEGPDDLQPFYSSEPPSGSEPFSSEYTSGPTAPPDSWHGIDHTSSWREMNGTAVWKEPEAHISSIEEFKQLTLRKHRRQINHVAAGVLIYLLAANILAVLLSFSGLGYSMDDGTFCIIIFGGAIPAVLLYMHGRDIPVRKIYHVRKHLTVKSFLELLCVFMMGQLTFSWFSMLMEIVLNMFGYSAMDAVESATSISDTLPMIIYAGFGAPLFEEFMYRGFTMQNLEKQGKVFAIVASSLFFGFMHGNAAQIPFAFAVGLVLGYTAMEYSIWASMLLHFINNFVFGDLLSKFLEILPNQIANAASSAVYIGFFVMGCIVLYHKRNDIADYIRQNRSKTGQWKALLTSIPFWIFIAYCGFEAVASLTAM